jgi:hypothetical protein
LKKLQEGRYGRAHLGNNSGKKLLLQQENGWRRWEGARPPHLFESPYALLAVRIQQDAGELI